MSITGKTQRLGLIGMPISHSFSPAMHNAASAALDIDFVYLPLPVLPGEVGTALKGLVALSWAGVNVTIPHKLDVMAHLDHVAESAEAIGAVNTIDFRADGLYGYNTDWTGFLADLDAHNISLENRDCILLGAGGSARGVVYALLSRGAHVRILARRPEAAQTLADSLTPWFENPTISAHDIATIPTLSTDNPLIINSTPLGTTPNTDRSAWPDSVAIPSGAVIYDLVYNPQQTKLMKQATTAGCEAYNGLGMLLWQGAHAFEIWTGEKPDIDVMRAALPF